MGYFLKNSAAKNNYFEANGGAAIGATTQPNLDGSTLIGPLDSSLPQDDTGLFTSRGRMAVYTGYDNTSILDWHTNTIRGASSTVLLSPGSDGYRNPIQKVRSLRTRTVALALTTGEFNVLSGIFAPEGKPVERNDFTAVGTDNAGAETRSVPTKMVYNWGAITTGISYGIKTQ